jgi:hypothetical protein
LREKKEEATEEIVRGSSPKEDIEEKKVEDRRGRSTSPVISRINPESLLM